MRKIFGTTYFRFRYLNAFGLNLNHGQIYKSALDYYKTNNSPLVFSESKMQELFEYSDKAKFLSASLISIDFSECGVLDNYKEGYPYTVILIKLT